MAISHKIERYKKLSIGTSISTCIGAMLYEYYKIKRTLNSLIDTRVLDFDKKHPDYIYIKYHIYRETMAKMKNEEQDKHWINIIINPFGKWWKTIKHSVAWRLLEIAKTGNQFERVKAVRQLASIDHLKDWDYQHLAQICDARTAVSLARHFCDTRWFLRPYAHSAVRHPKSIIYEIKEHLEKFRSHKCVQYYNSLNPFSILKGYTFETKRIAINLSNVTKQEYDCIKQCLELLLHLTNDKEIIGTLIRAGILSTLLEVQKLFQYNSEITFHLSKVIANISVCKEFISDFFVTSWISILANWTRNLDMRIQVTSAKALANLDIDDTDQIDYQQWVYPLYPQQRLKRKSDVDVIFIHGLLGGVFVTWRQKDRHEAELGLYGKNVFYTKESDDIFLVDEVKSIENNKRQNLSKAIDNKYVRKSNNNITINNKNFKVKYTDEVIVKNTRSCKETITYEESPPLIRKQTIKKKHKLSDIATKELIETLETASELESDWEIIFPDCPVSSNIGSNGPFSISGNEWINDDQDNDDYTYCWPMDWLPYDYPNLRIIGLNYETSLTEWTSNSSKTCPCAQKCSLPDRSNEFLRSLVAAGVGRNNRPIIWVGHSMGGLVAKSIIVQSFQSNDPKIKAIGENTRAILFLGTPHRGSPVAKLKQSIQVLLSPTIEVKEMCENAKSLLLLNEQFLYCLKMFKQTVQIVSVAEGKPTVITAFKFPFRLVTEESANLKIGDFYVLNIDHLGLSKPQFRQSFLYQRLLRIIDDVVEDKTTRPINNKKKSKELLKHHSY